MKTQAAAVSRWPPFGRAYRPVHQTTHGVGRVNFIRYEIQIPQHDAKQIVEIMATPPVSCPIASNFCA